MYINLRDIAFISGCADIHLSTLSADYYYDYNIEKPSPDRTASSTTRVYLYARVLCDISRHPWTHESKFINILVVYKHGDFASSGTNQIIRYAYLSHFKLYFYVKVQRRVYSIHSGNFDRLNGFLNDPKNVLL